MGYRRTARKLYMPLRRNVQRVKTATLRSKIAASPITKTREFQANIMDIALFLAKFLSGKNNIIVTPMEDYGFACRIEKIAGREYYNIIVPRWDKYDLPLDPKSKYRIFRSSIWHEAMHSRYTPEKVYSYGANTKRLEVTDPLRHDVINIIEDRRIEDLGVEMWRGYKPERLFSNGYFWSQRMNVGEFWKTYLEKYYDPQKGEFDLSSLNPEDRKAAREWLRQRLSYMRHEAFLQRLITGKIKGAGDLPLHERQLIEDTAARVEDELKKITKEKVSDRKVFQTLKSLTEKVIKDLQLQYYKPPIRRLGESSWDVTFTDYWADTLGTDDEEKVRAGIDDYFDEIVKVEYICEVCGKPYTKIYGHRHKPGSKSTPPPGVKGAD
jgi:hypothetical protein